MVKCVRYLTVAGITSPLSGSPSRGDSSRVACGMQHAEASRPAGLEWPGKTAQYRWDEDNPHEETVASD